MNKQNIEIARLEHNKKTVSQNIKVYACRDSYKTMSLDAGIVVKVGVLYNMEEVQLDYLGRMVGYEDESKGTRIVGSHSSEIF